MLKQSLLISALAIAALTFTSCTKEGPVGPAGTNGASLTGSIFDYIEIYDEFGKEITDKSGITVTVEGTNPVVTATTDAMGKFQINNLPTGTYDFVISKTGFGTIKYFGKSFVGGTKPTTLIENNDGSDFIEIAQMSTTIASELDTMYDFYHDLNFTCKVTPAGTNTNKRSVRFFISTDPNVSSSNYMETDSDYGTSSNQITAGFNYFHVFTPGTKIYVVAYGNPYNTSISYFDYVKNMKIYPSLNSHLRILLVIPYLLITKNKFIKIFFLKP